MVVQSKTIDTDVFSVISKLVLDNLPSYFHNGEQYTYKFASAYPETSAVFPLIVLNPVKINPLLINQDGSGEDYSIEIQLDFYTKVKHGKKAIDYAKQSLRVVFIENIPTFNTDNGLLPMETFWEDSDTSTFQDSNQILNTSSTVLRLKLR